VLAPVVVLALLGSVVTVLGLTLLVVLVVVARLAAEEGTMRDNPPPCELKPGRMGVVRAPGVFEKSAGSSWVLPRQATVLDTPGGKALCALPAGARIQLVEAPVRKGRDSWVAVDGGKLSLEPPEKPDPSPGELVTELCEGPAREPLGWLRISRSGASEPRQGGTLTLKRATEVRAGQDGGEVVCGLPAGTVIDVGEVRTGRKPLPTQFWVRITGGNFRLP
jgi:hypothetical protein